MGRCFRIDWLAMLLVAAICGGPLLAASEKPATATKSLSENRRLPLTPAPLPQGEKGFRIGSPDKARPAWIDAKEGLIEEGYQKIIAVGPFSTEAECDRDIPVRLVQAVEEYAQTYDPKLGPRLQIAAATLRQEQPRLVRDAYSETIASSVGPMRQTHLRVVFDRKFNRWLDQQLAGIVVARRVGMLGVFGGGVLAVLSVAWLWARRGTARAAMAG